MSINVARFDLVTIRLAVLCAELGSLSAASRRAHCSLSAGSQRLKGLEASLGRPLFVRDYRGLQLTQAGEAFMSHARAILRELELMLHNPAEDGDVVAGDVKRFAPRSMRPDALPMASSSM